MVPDLGIDRIVGYRVDLEKGRLDPDSSSGGSVEPGSGPRHFTFSSNGQQAFVINELSSTVTAFAYEPNSGHLTEIGSASTLPEGWTGHNQCAEIQLLNRFLYASNRGHDSIAIFRIDDETDAIILVDVVPTGGRSPRHFVLDPTEKYLLAANQKRGGIVAFRIDRNTGQLETIGQIADLPGPVCLHFVEPRDG